MCMAKRIKEQRLAMGYTQDELAHKLGLQKSAIAKYESGRVGNIKRSIIEQMAHILNCKPSYLMGWEEGAMENKDESIKKNISTNISKFRDKAGMNQKELAQKLGVTPSRVSNWEQGANCPTIDILFEVCEILKVSINDIYGIYPDSNIMLNYDEQDHIKKYRDLDGHGKEMVDFTLLKEWERSKTPATVSLHPTPMLNAARPRTDLAPEDITEEMIQHDEDIMNDPNF